MWIWYPRVHFQWTSLNPPRQRWILPLCKKGTFVPLLIYKNTVSRFHTQIETLINSAPNALVSCAVLEAYHEILVKSALHDRAQKTVHNADSEHKSNIVNEIEGHIQNVDQEINNGNRHGTHEDSRKRNDPIQVGEPDLNTFDKTGWDNSIKQNEPYDHIKPEETNPEKHAK